MPNQQSEMLQHAFGQMTKPQPGIPCAHFPDLTRLKYFYGQLLGVQDFQTEQADFRGKLGLHNRCLHGYGTVGGLEVVPEPTEPECETKTTDERLQLEEVALLGLKILDAEQLTI